MEAKEQKQNFLTGAAILSLSTIIVKIIGMFYKIPLKGIIGDAGYAYFNAAYSIYSVLLVISTTGLPVAMSRMVSEAHTLGNGRQMKRIFHTALIAYLSIGVLGTAIMMLLPRFLAGTVMGLPNASYSIFALGPAVVFICFASAGRGFFQGQGDMKPTAVSQIIEAAGKLILGLGFAWLVMRRFDNEALSSGATIAGISIGAGCSALYALMKLRGSSRRIDAMGGEVLSYKTTAKRLMAIAIPITIGSAGLQLINLLDEVTVTHRLLAAAQSSGVMIDRVLALAQKHDVQYAVENAKGIYSFAQTIFNLPISLIPCITVAIIPAITSYLTLHDQRGVRTTQDSAMRIMSLVAMPCAIGLLVLSEPVMALLGGYEGDKLKLAGWLLALLTPTILTNSVANMTTAVMQAHNHTVLPVINTLIGGLLKVAVNYILVGNPDIAILGAPIGTFVCYLVIMLLNIFAMRRTLQEPPKVLPAIWRSGLAALLMGGVAWLSYALLQKLIASIALCCLGAIAVAVVSYLLLVIAFRALTYEDCLLLPKGEKIAKILRIH